MRFAIARDLIVLAAPALFALMQPAHAINKCEDAAGKVTFQDAPCQGAGGKIEVRPASGYDNTSAAADAQGRVDALRFDNEISAAIREHRPMVGMTTAQLEQAMGLATRVNTDRGDGYLREQVIYERDDATWYVYTHNGRVQSTQKRPAVRHQNLTPAARTPCPTEHQIRDAITSAGSISLSTEEREQRWRAIREMRACGR